MCWTPLGEDYLGGKVDVGQFGEVWKKHHIVCIGFVPVHVAECLQSDVFEGWIFWIACATNATNSGVSIFFVISCSGMHCWCRVLHF